MHQNRVVLGGVEIHHRLQHLVLHLDELEGLVHALFVLTGHNGHHITHKTDVAVDDQSVTGACLREGLACLGVAGRILRDILQVKMASMPGTFLATVVLIVRTMAFA